MPIKFNEEGDLFLESDYSDQSEDEDEESPLLNNHNNLEEGAITNDDAYDSGSNKSPRNPNKSTKDNIQIIETNEENYEDNI